MSEQVLTDRSNKSSSPGVDGATFTQAELGESKPWRARSAAVEILSSLSQSRTDDRSAAKSTRGLLTRTRVRPRWNEMPLELSSSEVTNAPIMSADDQPSHGRGSVEALRQRRLQTRSSSSLPIGMTSREATKFSLIEHGTDVSSMEKATNMTTGGALLPVSTNSPQGDECDSVAETPAVDLPTNVSPVPIVEGDRALSAERTATVNEELPHDMSSDPTGKGKMEAGAQESTDPSSVGSSSRRSHPWRKKVTDEPAGSEAPDLSSEGVGSSANDIEEVSDPPRDESIYRTSRRARERMYVIGNDVKESDDPINANSGHGRWRERIASRTNDAEEQVDSRPVDTIRRSMPWRERIAARTSDVEDVAEFSPRIPLVGEAFRGAREQQQEQAILRNRLPLQLNDLDESIDLTLPFLSVRKPDDVHEKIAEVKSDDDDSTDLFPVLATVRKGRPSRETIASGISDVEVSDHPTPADSDSRKGLELQESTTDLKRSEDDRTDPLPSDSGREMSYSSIERVATGRNDLRGSLDSTTADSSNETSASGNSLDKDSTDLVPAHSTRMKSLVLRERIAVGRSPGSESDASGAGVHAAERRASIEARRAQLQAGIAERKKARDEAARLSESK
ncbi:hypothetical protein MHU86_17965 [Fragilaria crotonensis]|nr:hypothetical protein MHU86_17965 [Fragilaria crotonensis]